MYCVNLKIGATAEPWCYEATRNNIRHYAHGIGDDNPLWCDPEYAAKSQYGGIIALPSFLFSTSRIVSGYVGGLLGMATGAYGDAGASFREQHFTPLLLTPRRSPCHAMATP